jgi:hypothetical protein
MSVNAKQLDAVLRLPAPKKYSHFIKKAVGWGKIWGLYNEGWAMTELSDGTMILPIWPEVEYAERCIGGEWRDFTPKSIGIDEVLDSMIPMLQNNGVLPGVFFSTESGSVEVSLDEFERDLRAELSRYS